MRTLSRLFLAASVLMIATVAWSGDFKKGWNAYSAGDYATALSEWQELADSGDANAAYGMGLMYGNGFGVDMLDDEAIKYYSIAAEQGHAEAQFNLAVMHQNGWGVPQSDEKANEWYRLAADQGVTLAQIALGRYFSMDFLDSYDPVQAYMWFRLAEESGDMDAASKREFVQSRMTAAQVAEGDARVSAWKAAH
ncbi:MAG: tetratricopeptide repeat protein [Woeseiaceae bacterium]|jgi:TPR repeat protein